MLNTFHRTAVRPADPKKTVTFAVAAFHELRLRNLTGRGFYVKNGSRISISMPVCLGTGGFEVLRVFPLRSDRWFFKFAEF